MADGLFNYMVEKVRVKCRVNHGVFFYCSAYRGLANLGSFHRHKDGCFNNKIPTDDSNKGMGLKVLEHICLLADAYKIDIELSCTREKCQKLYESCGFKVAQDYGHWRTRMYREHK